MGDKEFVTWTGLLDLAHDRGLMSIETEMTHFIREPIMIGVKRRKEDGTFENVEKEFSKFLVIFKATATFTHEDGHKVFTGYGDSTEKNVSAMVMPHMIRMAETRAKARALRDGCNVGMCSEEEIVNGV